MKKILLSLSLVLVVLMLAVCPVAAEESAQIFEHADDREWVLSADQLTVTSGDLTYVRFSGKRSFSVDDSVYYSDSQYIDLEFENEKTEERFDGSFVNIFDKIAHIAVEVDIYEDGYYDDSAWYINEEYQSEFEEMKNGRGTSFATIDSYYTNYYDISLGIYSSWKGSDEITNIRADGLDRFAYEQYPFFVTDSSGYIKYETGLILRHINEQNVSEYYLIEYADYDRSYFYSDGYLATDHDGELKAYKLTNEKEAQVLTEFYDTFPDDELDWLVTEDTSDAVTLGFCIVFFGIIPLGVMVFAFVLFLRSRKNGYRRASVVMFSGAAAVIIAFITILIILV